MSEHEQATDAIPATLTAAYCQRRAAQALDQAQGNAGFESANSLNATAAGWHQLSQELRWVEQAAIDATTRALEDAMRKCGCIKQFEPTKPLVDLEALAEHNAREYGAAVSRQALSGL